MVKHAAMSFALYNRDILPTAISGTSAGGLVALALATGCSPHRLCHELHVIGPGGVRDRRWAWPARIRHLDAIHDPGAATRAIQRLIPAGREHLRIPCHVWGVDEDTCELLDLCQPEHGLNLQQAALATMSAPPMLPAVRAVGRRIVDGGVAFNVPLIQGWEAYDEVYLLIAADRLGRYPHYDILSRTVRAVQLMMAAQVDEVLRTPAARAMAQAGRLRVLWPDIRYDGGLLDLPTDLLTTVLLWAIETSDAWAPIDLRAAD